MGLVCQSSFLRWDKHLREWIYRKKRLFWLMVEVHDPLLAQHLRHVAVEIYSHFGGQEVKGGRGASLYTSGSRVTELLSARPYPLVFHLPPSHTTGS